MHDSDDAPLDPAEMLELVERQQLAVGLSFVKPVALLYTIWGVAWLAGFLLLWLAAVTAWMPLLVAATVFGILMLVSVIASGFIGARMGRGVQGASGFQSVVYGLAWPVTGIAFPAVGVALISHGMSAELAFLYFPSAYTLMVGILYLLGGALWNARSQLVLGLVLIAVGSVAPFFGAPANNLIMAIGGGGASLIGAVHIMVVLRKFR